MNQWAGVSLSQRFWPKVRIDFGCWEWQASRNRQGYGFLWHDGRMRGAHRVSYELHYGPIPEGLEIDHLCQNKSCVKPNHLEAVSHKVNTQRGITNRAPYRGQDHHNAKKTECNWGHPYIPENTIQYRGHRSCRECANRRNREHRYRQRLVRAGETLVGLVP